MNTLESKPRALDNAGVASQGSKLHQFHRPLDIGDCKTAAHNHLLHHMLGGLILDGRDKLLEDASGADVREHFDLLQRDPFQVYLLCFVDCRSRLHKWNDSDRERFRVISLSHKFDHSQSKCNVL